jgi:hypothetical protein
LNVTAGLGCAELDLLVLVIENTSTYVTVTVFKFALLCFKFVQAFIAFPSVSTKGDYLLVVG